MVALGTETARTYLEQQGLVPEAAAVRTRALPGGVSNHVIQAMWDDGCLVLKQPLANLAVEADWPADVDRVHNEAEAARSYARAIDDGRVNDVRVPAVHHEDRNEHIIAIECAPAGATTWKRDLLDGQVDPAIAHTVGVVLGTVHRFAADDPAIQERFPSQRPFRQLRVDPYHLATAKRHPDVADRIRQEARRVQSVERTLVHGDYSPKNVLIDRTGEQRLAWILDFEVAHWGDPAFDTAFMLNHLFIKSVYNHEQGVAYIDAADAFFDAYRERAPWDIERETVAELGVLMLARVDGKSPVEYVSEGPVAGALRRIAKAAIREEARTLAAFAAVVRQEWERL